jgi:hypothetical protein
MIVNVFVDESFYNTFSFNGEIFFLVNSLQTIHLQTLFRYNFNSFFIFKEEREIVSNV